MVSCRTEGSLESVAESINHGLESFGYCNATSMHRYLYSAEDSLRPLSSNGFTTENCKWAGSSTFPRRILILSSVSNAAFLTCSVPFLGKYYWYATLFRSSSYTKSQVG